MGDDRDELPHPDGGQAGRRASQAERGMESGANGGDVGDPESGDGGSLDDGESRGGTRLTDADSGGGKTGGDLGGGAEAESPGENGTHAPAAGPGRQEERQLSHVDESGRARMVDVGDKRPTRRRATASGRLLMAPSTLARIREGETPKGNVVEVARIAGIQAAKRTAELVPLCHPLPLSHVDVAIDADDDGLTVRSTVATTASTGVEIEALTAASVSLLTLYDMCKALERGMTITEVRLERKEGGRSGTWTREPVED